MLNKLDIDGLLLASCQSQWAKNMPFRASLEDIGVWSTFLVDSAVRGRRILENSDFCREIISIRRKTEGRSLSVLYVFLNGYGLLAAINNLFDRRGNFGPWKHVRMKCENVVYNDLFTGNSMHNLR